MATSNKQTIEATFGCSPEIKSGMFSVKPGNEIDMALLHAAALEESVQSLLKDSLQDGMNAETVFLCRFAMDAASALREAAHSV